MRRSFRCQDTIERRSGRIRWVSQGSTMPEASRESGALTPALFMPGDFEFGAVPSTEGSTQAPPPAHRVPGLGPLSAFTGTFHGLGFNQIFRPDIGSPTP